MNELRIRAKNKEGKEILETKVAGDIEKRISRKPKGAVWIVWKRDNLGRPRQRLR